MWTRRQSALKVQDMVSMKEGDQLKCTEPFFGPVTCEVSQTSFIRTRFLTLFALVVLRKAGAEGWS